MAHQESLAERVRRVIRAVTPLVEERAKQEAHLSQRLRDQSQLIEREHGQAVSARETATQTARNAIESEKLALMDLIRTKHEKDFGEAHGVMTADLAAFADTTARLEAKADQKLEDSKWLADTLVESGEGKARAEFETSAKDHRMRQEEVDAVRVRAANLLTQNGHGAIPPASMQAAIDAAKPPAFYVEACRAAGQTLEGRIKPAMLRPSSIMIAAVLFGLGGGGLATWKMGVSGLNIGLGAGGGVAVALVILLAARLLLRQRVPSAAAALATRLAEADAALKAFLDRAEESRDKIVAEAKDRRDKELAKGQGRYATARQEIDRRKLDQEPELRGRHRAVLDRIHRKTGERSSEVDGDAGKKLAALKLEHQAAIDQAGKTRAQRVESAKREHDEGLAQLRSRWTEGMRFVRDELRAISESVGPLTKPWEGDGAPDWENFKPVRTTPVAARFGVMNVNMAAMAGGAPADASLRAEAVESFDLPALLDFLGTGSLLIQAGPEQRADSVAALQAVMLRLLTTFPPGKLKFTIIDPVGLGQSFAGFMHLADHDESLVSDKIWTDPRHIEQKLTDITEHMEAVIQKYLRNEFATIHDYNEKAGEVAEPFRFLVVADFPANFTETAARRLASIVASGPRCGVYTLIATDARQRPPAWVPMPEIERASVNIVGKDGKLSWKDADFAPWPLVTERPPSEDVVTRIAHAVGKHAKENSRVQVPFGTVVPKGEELWTRTAAGDLRVPLGKAGATKIQQLTLGRGTSQHVLIAGRTGSGKSTLLHALITSAMLWYSPWELELYLVDFKKGVEFKTYASHGVPHARVIAVESEREFGLSVLRKLDAELTRRGNLFRELGVQDLASYRKAKGEDYEGVGSAGRPSIPRTLLIVDEFQEFFTEDDKIAQEGMLLMDRLVRQGRAFGMHVILGSQTIGGAYSLARATIGQMAIRIALQCSEADSYLILSEDNAAARLLSRPGEAIYNDQSGMIEGNSPFQVVWLPDEVRDTHLDAVVERTKRAGWSGEPPIVFEGNVPSHLPRNYVLGELLAGRAAAPNLPTVWLGEAISIKDPTNVRFRRQSGSNILIVGQQEISTLGLIVSIVVSLAAQFRGKPAPTLTILDGGSSDSESTPTLVRMVERWGAGATIVGSRGADAAVAAVYDEFQKRTQGGGGEHPVFLIVSGLQRFRSLRKNDGDFGFGGDEEGPATKADKQFASLIKDGPAMGVFVIVRVDTSTNLERAMDRRMLKEFDYRVLFQMSANDSSNLIDSTAAGNLGQHRGLLYSEETGQIEKFRPYAIPEDAWLDGAVGGR